MRAHQKIIRWLAIPAGITALFLVAAISGTSNYGITASHADGYYSNRGGDSRYYSNDRRDREHRDNRDQEEPQNQPYYQSPYGAYIPYGSYIQPYEPDREDH